MATPCEPSVSVASLAPGVISGRSFMRRPGRQRWVPSGILVKADEVVVPVAPPPQYQKKVVLEAREDLEEKEALLPEGTPLLSVSGVELPESAVGPALEFLEFCSAFYKPLGMKKSEAEKSLHEVVKGCNLKKGSQCQVVQVFVRLLSVVLYGTDEECNVASGYKSKNSWLEVLKKYLYKKSHPDPKGLQSRNAEGEEIKVKETEGEESEVKDAEAVCSFKPSPTLSHSVASPSNSTLSPIQESVHKFAAALESGADGFESLSIEEKLQLLNLLCNDVLGTAVLRGHIERVMFEYNETRKEEKEKSKSAKKKVKLDLENLKESLLTETSISKGPGTEALRSDAVKTEPVVWDGPRAVWKLKGGNDRTDVTLQVIADIEGIPKEKWTVYSEADKEVLAVYLNQKKNGRRRARKRYQLKTIESHPVMSIDAGADAKEILSDERAPTDGDLCMSSSSSDDSGCDQESEPEPEPEFEE
uniref:DDT domain-containing protein n=1 Tax=Physcomitrium patens TaxID=3218 RepID=A0A7I4CV13_PHYPA